MTKKEHLQKEAKDWHAKNDKIRLSYVLAGQRMKTEGIPWHKRMILSKSTRDKYVTPEEIKRIDKEYEKEKENNFVLKHPVLTRSGAALAGGALGFAAGPFGLPPAIAIGAGLGLKKRKGMKNILKKIK